MDENAFSHFCALVIISALEALRDALYKYTTTTTTTNDGSCWRLVEA